ncbi:hypothetical protein L1987_58757 [Smallanthus sonchifolius]|uniref:Uncharacterized protein n=1 Tax=Smallanthus sonchifolius TaxID=185202 RepID=A0ACB9D3J2_9ASTR|nr:hypothetical protein L1987_58757 [Smallanthus sonchifolius]
MAEEFQAEVFSSSSFKGNYGGCWQNDFMNLKTRSTDESSGCCATAILPDSAMGPSPSTTTNWYQALLINGRTGESTYNQTLPEILNNLPAGGQNSSNFGMDQEHTSYGYPSSLLQTLLYGASPPAPPPAAAPPQQPLYDFQVNLNDFDPVSSMPGFSSELNSFFDIKSRNEEIRDLGSSVKKSCSESTFKRARIETPSPLPTFKVRKEKLGDRVTALQQLVSPFGKTDTASVLHEAIEYIKLLHDQINVLSKPYMSTMQVQQINNKVNDYNEGAKQQELRSRGLCLVPMSSTFPVAIDQTTPDYWTSRFRNI